MTRLLLIPLVVLAGRPLFGAEDAALARARRVLKTTPIIDGHNDLPWAIRENATAPKDVEAYDLRSRTPGATDLARLREGGIGGQFWSVYVPAEMKSAFARTQLEQIDIARRIITRYPDTLEAAATADDVKRAMKRRRVASLLGIEGGHAIENSLGALRAYFDLGVRYMTLTHSTTLEWADAAGDPPRHGGLTPFGEEVVREMNRLGMLVDLSHVTPETMEDAIRVSEAPVIFSHSSARALCDHVRNVPDDVLTLMPKNGGVVMVTFVASFVSDEVRKASEPLWAELKARAREVEDPAELQRLYKEMSARMPKIKVTIAEVADHVEHVRKTAGVDHVGLGGDYDGNDSWPEGMEDVSGYPRLFAELIRRGWSDADLAKLAQGNVLRVMRQAEGVARRLQKSRPASLATIEALDGRAATPAATR
ncbi:MAG TPA: dipeptidase [Vicinamibacteria bacterium]|nr:dipeptidase [Vicinamibacteria bacterium]